MIVTSALPVATAAAPTAAREVDGQAVDARDGADAPAKAPVASTDAAASDSAPDAAPGAKDTVMAAAAADTPDFSAVIATTSARNAPPRPGPCGACAPICIGVVGWVISGIARTGALVVAMTAEKSGVLAAAAAITVSKAPGAASGAESGAAASADATGALAGASAPSRASTAWPSTSRAAVGAAAVATGRALVTITGVSGSVRSG